MPRFFASLTALTILLTASSTAQAQVMVSPGSIVRVHSTSHSTSGLVGTVVSRTPDTLVVVAKEGGSLIRFPQHSIAGLEMRNGKHRLMPALKYAAIGGAVWGVVAMALPFRECDPERYSNCDQAIGKSEFVISQALGMALITGVIGAVRGADRWVQVEGAPAAR